MLKARTLEVRGLGLPCLDWSTWIRTLSQAICGMYVRMCVCVYVQLIFVCKIKKAYDRRIVKVHLAGHQQIDSVIDAVVAAMVLSGARERRGPGASIRHGKGAPKPCR